VGDEQPAGDAARLLIAIGTLLIVEAGVAWEPAGLPLGDGGRAVVGLGAGLAIGTLSLLISLPTVLTTTICLGLCFLGIVVGQVVLSIRG
jgi:hypothetical protein